MTAPFTVLTPDESSLLLELANPKVATIGRKRLLPVLGIITRLHDAIQGKEMEKRDADFIANSFWLAASGIISEDQIRQHPRFTEQQRNDVLAIVQLRYDAEAWREHCGFDLPPLPTADLVDPVAELSESEQALAANEELYSLPRIG